MAAAAIAAVGSVRGLDRDLGTAVVVTTAFGGGVLLALSPATPRGLNAVLFGDALAVEPQDLVVTAAVVAALLVALVVLHHRLLAVGFDRGAAALIGARPRATEVALLICIAAAVVVGTQALGSLLVVAILVAPAATARLVARRLPAMFAVAAAVALAAQRGRDRALVPRRPGRRRLDRAVPRRCLPGDGGAKPRAQSGHAPRSTTSCAPTT